MAQQEESAKQKMCKTVIAHIIKHFGDGAIMSLGDFSAKRSIATIKTGALSLDLALGIGGIPRGRITEIYGPESSGKSTLALHLAANCQQEGGIVAYIDAEHALDPSYAGRIGVKVNDLLLSQPECGEDGLNIADTLARSNAIDLIIIDSVAALVPRAELEGEIGDAHVGLQARLMSQALRKLASTLAKSNTCAVFINQIREKVGVMFGNPETTTGGRALKFYSSIRLEIKRKESIKGAGETNESGIRVKVTVKKNKMAPPFRFGEFDIFFNEGISRLGSIIDMGVEYNVVEKKGAWFAYKGKNLGHGKPATIEELKKQAALCMEIEQEIIQKVKKIEETGALFEPLPPLPLAATETA